MQETQEAQVQSLGQEEPLEEETATHASILASKILWTEELSQAHEVRYPKAGDFIVDRKHLFEVGGKGKAFDQIKDIPDSYLAVDNTETGHKNRIPLWMFGLLY